MIGKNWANRDKEVCAGQMLHFLHTTCNSSVSGTNKKQMDTVNQGNSVLFTHYGESIENQIVESVQEEEFGWL